MGAEFITTIIETTAKTKILKKYKAIVEECIYEHGHNSYNGTFSTMEGIEIKNKTFKDYNEAYEYICDNQEKWGPAFAVTVKEKGRKPYTLVGGWAAI